MKNFLIVALLLFAVTGALLANGGQSVTIYKFETPTGWVAETNPILASATAVNEWTTQDDPDHVMYNGTPYLVLSDSEYYNLPKIEWEVNVSQWIYVDIEYLNFEMHVDMPGDYMVDDLQISLKTNGGVNVYFDSRGNLKSAKGDTIPTWIGYTDTNNGTLIPQLGSTNAQFSWVKMSELPNSDNFLTILKPCGTIHPCGLGEKSYRIWFGFRVNAETCKGDYSTYVDIFIQSDP